MSDPKSSRFVPTAVAAVSIAALCCIVPMRVIASVPSGSPVFTTPLSFSNQFFPFVPNAVNVFRGEDGDATLVVTDLYLPETRTFSWNGGSVETHVLAETEFEDGQLSEISHNFFAQADNGSVYYFGEVVDIYEDGQVVAHDGSWLVGGATLPGDPVGTGNAPNPGLIMVADPEVGDAFKPEDLAPIVDETVTVKKFVNKLHVEAGTFHDVMLVKETSELEPGAERKWWARGVGVIRTKHKSEKLELIASTLLPVGP